MCSRCVPERLRVLHLSVYISRNHFYFQGERSWILHCRNVFRNNGRKTLSNTLILRGGPKDKKYSRTIPWSRVFCFLARPVLNGWRHSPRGIHPQAQREDEVVVNQTPLEFTDEGIKSLSTFTQAVQPCCFSWLFNRDRNDRICFSRT